MATAQIEVLGRFSVSVDRVLIPAGAWRHRRAADVVKMLALAPGHRLPRGELMEALWPEQAPERSGASLRKAVHFARAAIGDAGVIVAERGVLLLWPAVSVSTDVEAFESAARRAIEAADPSACLAADAAYPGGLLPDDRVQDWTVEPRERLHQLHLDVLRAGRLWSRVLEADPTDEHAARALMLAELEAGERREAIRCFERLRQALGEQLGVGPDIATVELYERVLAAEGDAPPTEQERALALLARALIHVNRGELEEGRRTAETAKVLAMHAGLGRVLGEAATILSKIAMLQGVWQERFADELADSMRSPMPMEPIVYDAHLCVAEFYLAGAEGRAGAAALARRMMLRADEAGSPAGAALALLMLGEARLLEGDLAQAETDLRRAATANEALGCISGAALARQRLAEAAVTQGRRSSAKRLLTRARSLADRSDIAAHLMVRVFDTMMRAASDSAHALAVLRTAEEDRARRAFCEPCSMGYLTTAAAVSADAGRMDQADRFLADAERISGMWQSGQWGGAVWEARGHVRAAEGDQRQARAMFAEAAAAFERSGDARAAQRCRAAARPACAVGR